MYCMSRASALHRFSDTMAARMFLRRVSSLSAGGVGGGPRSVPHQFVPTSKSRVADFAGARHESYKVSSELAPLSGMGVYAPGRSAQTLEPWPSSALPLLRATARGLPSRSAVPCVLFLDFVFRPHAAGRIDYTSRHCPSAANAQA